MMEDFSREEKLMYLIRAHYPCANTKAGRGQPPKSTPTPVFFFKVTTDIYFSPFKVTRRGGKGTDVRKVLLVLRPSLKATCLDPPGQTPHHVSPQRPSFPQLPHLPQRAKVLMGVPLSSPSEEGLEYMLLVSRERGARFQALVMMLSCSHERAEREKEDFARSYKR